MYLYKWIAYDYYMSYDDLLNCVRIPRWSLGYRYPSRPRLHGISSPFESFMGLLPKCTCRIHSQSSPLKNTKSERRGLWVWIGYVMPIVADCWLSTAILIDVIVIVSWKYRRLRLSSSTVDLKFKSPQRMINVDELSVPAPFRSLLVRNRRHRSDCRFRSSTSFPGESKCALPIRIYGRYGCRISLYHACVSLEDFECHEEAPQFWRREFCDRPSNIPSPFLPYKENAPIPILDYFLPMIRISVIRNKPITLDCGICLNYLEECSSGFLKGDDIDRRDWGELLENRRISDVLFEFVEPYIPCNDA